MKKWAPERGTRLQQREDHMTRTVDTVIIGAGTAGLYALRYIKRRTKDYLLVNAGAYGTTCARIGCMPSKALIGIADRYHDIRQVQKRGLLRGELPPLDRDRVFEEVRRIRNNLSAGIIRRMEKLREAGKRIDGAPRFLDAETIEVNGEKIIAGRFIVATGSSPVLPGAWKKLGDRVISTDRIFEIRRVPDSLVVVGLGAIGLEIGQAFARLGVSVTGVEMTEFLASLTDPGISRMVQKEFSREMTIITGHRARIEEGPSGGLTVSAGETRVDAGMVLAALGRKPNLEGLDIGKTGAELDERGIPRFDPRTMKVPGTRLYLAGDVTGREMMMHAARREGEIAGYHAWKGTAPDVQPLPSLAATFSDPNIVQVGRTAFEGDESVVSGADDFAGNGRARVMGKTAGRVQIFARRESGIILGAVMAGPEAEHLGSLVSLAVQRGMTARELNSIPYYHPTIEETLQDALEDLMKKLDG